MSDMPLFGKGQYFLGFVEHEEVEKLLTLLEKYKCKSYEINCDLGRVELDNPFRIDSIRKRIWRHRWAIHKNWIDENPDLNDFDPRKKYNVSG